MMCFDCEQEGDDEDPGCGHPVVYCSCDCHVPPEERDDYEGDRGQPCIGADCCNPHLHHDRSECCTAEMMEAWAADAKGGA